MRNFALLSLFLLFFLSSTVSHPIHRHQTRGLETELVEEAEEGVELFDFPRVHDTTEQVHERVEQNNVTTANIVAELQQRESRTIRLRTSRLPSGRTVQTYSYNGRNMHAGTYTVESEANGWGRESYADVNRESGFGSNAVGVTA